MFVPTTQQAYYKAKLQLAIEGMSHLDLRELTAEQIRKAASHPDLTTWLADPVFAEWIRDPDDIAVAIQGSVHKALAVLQGILDNPHERGSVKTKAADLLLKLADKFPAQRKEVSWIDKDVADMDAAEVQRQIEKERAKLALKSGAKDG